MQKHSKHILATHSHTFLSSFPHLPRRVPSVPQICQREMEFVTYTHLVVEQKGVEVWFSGCVVITFFLLGSTNLLSGRIFSLSGRIWFLSDLTWAGPFAVSVKHNERFTQSGRHCLWLRRCSSHLFLAIGPFNFSLILEVLLLLLLVDEIGLLVLLLLLLLLLPVLFLSWFEMLALLVVFIFFFGGTEGVEGLVSLVNKLFLRFFSNSRWFFQ